MDLGYLFVGLFRSLAYSSLVVLAYSISWRSLKADKLAGIVAAALFSIVAIAALNDPMRFSNGAIYDGSVPVLALSYGFLGGLGAIVVGAVVLAFATTSAGHGLFLETSAIIATIATGIVVTRLPDQAFSVRWTRSLLLGVIAPTPMALLHFAEADSVSGYAVAASFLTVNAAGVIVLYDLLSNERDRIAHFHALQQDASVDPLTRLSNRRSFYSNAAAALDLLSKKMATMRC